MHIEMGVCSGLRTPDLPTQQIYVGLALWCLPCSHGAITITSITSDLTSHAIETATALPAMETRMPSESALRTSSNPELALRTLFGTPVGKGNSICASCVRVRCRPRARRSLRRLLALRLVRLLPPYTPRRLSRRPSPLPQSHRRAGTGAGVGGNIEYGVRSAEFLSISTVI